MLHGRGGEQSRIASAIESARGGRSAALTLLGPAGIGKSALLGYAAEQAAGMRLLRCTGVESEAELAYASLHLLLRPVLDEIERLPPQQAGALRAALGMSPGPAADRFLVGLAVLSLLADLAADQPLLCLVDDAHWLDTASAEALLFAARRLGDEAVVLLFAARDEQPARTGAADPAGLARIAVAGLDSAAAQELLTECAPGLTRHQRQRILAEAAGNPLALRELPAALDRVPVLDSLPLPARIQDAYSRRIAELPPTARRFLTLVAAAAEDELNPILRAATALGVGDADIEHVEGTGLIVLGEGTARFRHPLARTAAYQAAAFTERVRAHRALADALDGAEDDEADRRVWHLARAADRPDEEIAARLEDTAERARRRNGFAAAAAALERAAALSAETGPRARRLTLAAESALDAGLWARADALARRAARLSTDAVASARLTALRARVAGRDGRLRAAISLLLDASAGLREADPAANLAVLTDAMRTAWFLGEPALITAAGDAIRTGPWPEPYMRATSRAALALEDLAAGRQAAAQPPIAALVAAGRAPGADPATRSHGSGVALINGDFPAALEIAHLVVADLRAAGVIGALPLALQTQAIADTLLGHFPDAIAACTEGIQLDEDTGQTYHVAHLRAILALALAYRGEEEVCRGHAGAALAFFANSGGVNGATVAQWALGVLDLGLGRYAAALDRFETTARGPARHQMDVIYYAPDQIEAAVRLGRPHQAAAPLELYRDWVEAAGQPWSRAVLDRCFALAGPRDEAEDRFVSALARHADTGRAFEHGRTELLYGEWLRRRHRVAAARGPLRAALDRFHHTGAATWAERARAELRAAGEADPFSAPAPTGTGTRGPAVSALLDRLTPQERQVVRLAAQGSGNREIAAQLFLSPRTVSHHLYRAFPKLGVTSRTELARLVLATGPAGA